MQKGTRDHLRHLHQQVQQETVQNWVRQHLDTQVKNDKILKYIGKKGFVVLLFEFPDDTSNLKGAEPVFLDYSPDVFEKHNFTNLPEHIKMALLEHVEKSNLQTQIGVLAIVNDRSSPPKNRGFVEIIIFDLKKYQELHPPS